MTGLRTFAAAAALFPMIATPVAAADIPVAAGGSAYGQAGIGSTQDAGAYHRRWRGRDRIDAGDVIAGVAIIAGIAAIASAVESGNERKRERYDDYPPYEQERQYRAGNLDRAVGACTRAVERDARVDRVDEVRRLGEGWEVRGRLFDGSSFSCTVSGEGRIDRLDYGDGYQGSPGDYDADDDNRSDAYRDGEAAPGQLSDDAYAEARAAQGGAYLPQTAPQGAQPAYPGGPLPGEEIDGDIGA